MAKKRERGRPMELKYPPRIDATPAELVQAMFRAGEVRGPVSGRVYHCGQCGEEVTYPDTLHQDGRCGACYAIA